jgi:hypothetical protein
VAEQARRVQSGNVNQYVLYIFAIALITLILRVL